MFFRTAFLNSSKLICQASRLQFKTVLYIPLKVSQNRIFIKVSPKIEEKLRHTDNLPPSYQLIYREKKYVGIGLLYHGVVLMTCITLGAAAYYVYADLDLDFKKLNEKLMPVFVSSKQLIAAVLFLPILTVMVVAMIIRFPIRIYYSPKDKKYRTIFFGKFPFSYQFYDFPAGTIYQVKYRPINPITKVTFNANGKKLILLEEKFRTPDDFYKMLEYRDFVR